MKRSLAVTGGRHHRVTLEEAERLTRLIHELDIDSILVGDCPTGVDQWIRAWCDAGEIPFAVFEAEWERYGRVAGPIRNRDMVRYHTAVGLLAFNGGRGTGSCIREARKAGMPVHYAREGLPGRP